MLLGSSKKNLMQVSQSLQKPQERLGIMMDVEQQAKSQYSTSNEKTKFHHDFSINFL
jgi:hypothetical protein